MPDPLRLTIALRVEGPSDFDFFEPLLRRLAQRSMQPGMRLAPLIRIGRREKARASLIQVIREAVRTSGVAVVCLHNDADSRRRYQAILKDLHDICLEAHADPAPPTFGCVPIVPLRETEAWALADLGALCEVLGVTALPADWATRLQSPEEIEDPKDTMRKLVAEVRGRRRSLQPMSQLGELVSLQELERLPSFKAARVAFDHACAAVLTHPSSAPR
jgi:hypothetical protein